MTKRDLHMLFFGAILGVGALYATAWMVTAMEPPDSPYPFSERDEYMNRSLFEKVSKEDIEKLGPFGGPNK